MSVRRKLRGLFERDPRPDTVGATSGSATEGTPSTASSQSSAEDGRSVEGVLTDLCRYICATSSDALVEADIDPSLPMYDAGYVDSITGADLLVHIETQYGLFIPETDLVGRLCSLDALAQHIADSAA